MGCPNFLVYVNGVVFCHAYWRFGCLSEHTWHNLVHFEDPHEALGVLQIVLFLLYLLGWLVDWQFVLGLVWACYLADEVGLARKQRFCCRIVL